MIGISPPPVAATA